MIIQAWAGGKMINPYYVQNYKNAIAAGISKVDIYAFACNNCNGNTPVAIVAAIKASLACWIQWNPLA
jgi:hypothetical protein